MRRPPFLRRRSRSAEEASLEELIALFCDPRKAERAQRRWDRHAARSSRPSGDLSTVTRTGSVAG